MTLTTTAANTQPTAANKVRSIMRVFASDIEDKAWFLDRDEWSRYLDFMAAQRWSRVHLAFGLSYDFPRGVRDSYLYFAYRCASFHKPAPTAAWSFSSVCGPTSTSSSTALTPTTPSRAFRKKRTLSTAAPPLPSSCGRAPLSPESRCASTARAASPKARTTSGQRSSPASPSAAGASESTCTPKGSSSR